MATARTKTSALFLLAALLLMAGTPIAAQAAHKPCAAVEEHACVKIAALTQCCCCQSGDLSGQLGPTEDRASLGANPQAVDVMTLEAALPTADVGVCRIEPSPPIAQPPDFPVLFADLRL